MEKVDLTGRTMSRTDNRQTKKKEFHVSVKIESGGEMKLEQVPEQDGGRYHETTRDEERCGRLCATVKW